MRYVQLRAFHNVAIHGGFSRAAEAMNLTQPALSDQVRKLEAEYDVRLFDRRKKQVVVTKEGERLLEITRRLFEVEEMAHDILSERQALRAGSLRIIADSPHHVIHVLTPFRARYPGVRVSVHAGNTETVAAQLTRYEADIGVLGHVPPGGEYDAIPLSTSPIIAFVAKDSPLARRRSISLAELARTPLVLREKGSRTRAKIEAAFAEAGLKPVVGIEAEGREAVREIVAGGGGVGVVSAAEIGIDPRLAKLELSDVRLTMEEALICLRERRDSKVVRAFMSMAVAVAG
ncbi:MAG: LysR substrate-binding domain-containing protein [Paracoccaceae bacterium]